MVQQPIPPTQIDPHDDDVEDDSLLRPVTAPPERDRIQAGGSRSSGTPIVPLAIVAIILIALLLLWVF